MDLNLVVLSGRLAAPPEHRSFDSGDSCSYLLVTIRSDLPSKRIDVVPVTWWDPDERFMADLVPGTRLWIVGSVQRRFWSGHDGRRSKLDVIARAVNILTDDPAALPC